MSAPPPVSPASAPPGAWRNAARVRRAVAAPIERFLRIESASGLLLIAGAIVALVWVNSPWAASYTALLHLRLGVSLGGLEFIRPLEWWINDVLMTIFFFVAGLEIKRELVDGELANLRRAALPILAAVGGMLAPAALYGAFNGAGPASHGWGIPMATDIAFAVGVLSLLGRRVPPALRVLLLALAIIDDIGAILVIAVFYASTLHFEALGLIALGFLSLFALRKAGVRAIGVYLVPGALIWAGTYWFGVHPTIAGVALGLLTPHASWYGKEGFLAEAEAVTEDFRERVTRPHQDEELHVLLTRLGTAEREALSPLARLQHALHGYVAFGIMPIFALGNAGVAIGGVELGDPAVRLAGLGVAVGLVLGKPLGIVLASWLAVKAGIAVLPRGIGWWAVGIVGLVGGVGFTMAIFVANLAFAGGGPQAAAFEAVAKLAILVGSFVAAVIGLVVGRLVLPGVVSGLAATTAEQAEQSDAL